MSVRRLTRQGRPPHENNTDGNSSRHGLLARVGQIAGSAESTLSAVLGAPGGLFKGPGSVFSAELTLDDTSRLPGGTELLRGGRVLPMIVKFSESTDDIVARTLCMKVRDAYGPGHDQDFLFASSLDGAPGHHAVVHRRRAEGLYSSLWLYLAGWTPVAFGARVADMAYAGGPVRGDRIEFLAAGALSRFRRVGEITLGDELTRSRVSFAGAHCGGGLRALPPALLYTS